MPTQEPVTTENIEENDVPTSTEAKTTTARRKQSDASKRATFEMLKNKKRREKGISDSQPSSNALQSLSGLDD